MAEVDENSKEETVSPVIRLRNYIPKCQTLRKKYCVKPASFIDIKDEFTELIEKSKTLNHDIHDIAPKKSNWDLKRDCKTQLDELRYSTQLAIRAIVEQKQANVSSDDDDDDEEDSGSDDTNGDDDHSE